MNARVSRFEVGGGGFYELMEPRSDRNLKCLKRSKCARKRGAGRYLVLVRRSRRLSHKSRSEKGGARERKLRARVSRFEAGGGGFYESVEPRSDRNLK